MSVVWNLDADYQVKKVWFGRTVIRSRYKLSYEVAQRLCDGAAASHIRRDIPELMNSDLKLEELQKRYGVKMICNIYMHVGSSPT